jgi:twitching motility protein PilU
MINTPHITDLIRKGDVSTIKEAIQLSGEKGVQSFDYSLVELFTAGRLSMDDALTNADSRTNLEAKINFG